MNVSWTSDKLGEKRRCKWRRGSQSTVQRWAGTTITRQPEETYHVLRVLDNVVLEKLVELVVAIVANQQVDDQLIHIVLETGSSSATS